MWTQKPRSFRRMHSEPWILIRFRRLIENHPVPTLIERFRYGSTVRNSLYEGDLGLTPCSLQRVFDVLKGCYSGFVAYGGSVRI